MLPFISHCTRLLAHHAHRAGHVVHHAFHVHKAAAAFACAAAVLPATGYVATSLIAPVRNAVVAPAAAQTNALDLRPGTAGAPNASPSPEGAGAAVPGPGPGGIGGIGERNVDHPNVGEPVVTSIAEPGSAALVLVGLAIMGGVLRRKRKPAPAN
jgi:hypothetical protein